MRTVLFFDDWVIDRRRGLERIFPKAEAHPDAPAMQFDDFIASYSECSVHYDRAQQQWMLWSSVCLNHRTLDASHALALHTSHDGLHWQPAHQPVLVDRRATAACANVVFSGDDSCSGNVLYDAAEPDPDRRFKLVYSDQGKTHTKPHSSKVACSPDGIHWHIDREAVWCNWHNDANHTPSYNPFTKMYQFCGRSVSADRRITLFQTPDFKTFEKPLVILYPDSAESECVEYYGMPQFHHNGYYIGFLWKHYTGIDSEANFRMKGRVVSELVYSTNGISWNRTNRESIFPAPGMEDNFVASRYAWGLVEDDEGYLRVYGTQTVGEHGEGRRFAEGEHSSGLTISRWRKDGFCMLQTRADEAELVLRPLFYRGGDIMLNAQMARFGFITCELRDAMTDRPLKGFGFEDSVPLTGDGTRMPLRWRNADPNALGTIAIKLAFRLRQARLYSLTANADYLIGNCVHTDLAGSWDPEYYHLDHYRYE